jgi:hypothetical protein
VPNGTAVLIYASEAGRATIPALAGRLADQPWVGAVVNADALRSIGQTPARGLALFVSMAADEAPNAFGVPGSSFAAKPLAGKPDRLGAGQHGGTGRYEQSPVLMIEGEGFAAGRIREEASSIVDIAPTILAHHGRPADAMTGRALQAGNRAPA